MTLVRDNRTYLISQAHGSEKVVVGRGLLRREDRVREALFARDEHRLQLVDPRELVALVVREERESPVVLRDLPGDSERDVLGEGPTPEERNDLAARN